MVGAWNDIGSRVRGSSRSPRLLSREKHLKSRTPFRWEGAARRPGAAAAYCATSHPTRL